MLNDFASWIDKNLNITIKSKRDVVSRLRRAKALIDIDKIRDDDEARYLLSKNSEFASISKTIQSQLKRSISLYLQFKASV